MVEQSKNKKDMVIFTLIVCLLTALDQFTKWLAATHLKTDGPFVLWSGVFELRYLENRGSAFGLLQGQRVLFLILALMMLIVIPYIYLRMPHTKHFMPLRIVLTLLLSGAVGNAVDRMLNGFVIDFFYFVLINFPIFNVADIYVTVATLALFLLVMVYYKDEDFEQLFGRHSKGQE